VCTACSAGKYLTNATGSTEAALCTAVSITLVCWYSIDKTYRLRYWLICAVPKWIIFCKCRICMHGLCCWQVPDESRRRHRAIVVHKRELTLHQNCELHA
jgi:hypothetical protein